MAFFQKTNSTKGENDLESSNDDESSQRPHIEAMCLLQPL